LSNFEKGDIYYRSQEMGDLETVCISSYFDSF